ncbi:hypothetical protein [Rhodanobacter sp. A1T4]|uniref:hypothetical protein n=1 Tax=Rhodanobacter sp. A1T4 TaxID=2723087 RepID=UPI00160F3917|nr:hypothetical protein [Rhodanobacter sp. A1T4]MBB6247217.1 hypothetical protein [Rhodanobacter sp. A1T4]
MAALNDALAIAIESIPEHCHREIKHAVGRAMSAIMDETINPAILAFPELKPSQDAWCAVAKTRARARADSFAS